MKVSSYECRHTDRMCLKINISKNSLKNLVATLYTCIKGAF